MIDRRYIVAQSTIEELENALNTPPWAILQFTELRRDGPPIERRTWLPFKLFKLHLVQGRTEFPTLIWHLDPEGLMKHVRSLRVVDVVWDAVEAMNAASAWNDSQNAEDAKGKP